ncbi:MAG: bifunctional proline dehydrogenase/L-glutamate gamma-semialdehyde dehydrogenase, partial [Proteobacteria bacterium]|nr:bifunctional proline dehydrogenase/L-glutamate gamma-semialdehyde dehydrogenase [Pseudomonadota bacterium]
MLERLHAELPQSKRALINKAYRIDELTIMNELIEKASLDSANLAAVRGQATKLVEEVRAGRKKSTGIDSFLTQYSLSSEEGIALMCLAEALLRVPDKATIDGLIKDKLTKADWEAHRGQSESFFVNATTWALMLTGKVLTPEKADSTLSKTLLKLVNRSGEPVVRAAVDKAMRIMSKQFVTGRTINEAISRAKKKEAIGYRYSYDMLGEAALTAVDAERYFEAYKTAI